jgi:hypothetical protein
MIIAPNSGVRVDRTNRELRLKPAFNDFKPPYATKSDIFFLEKFCRDRAISAAIAISSSRDAEMFIRDVGLAYLFDAITDMNADNNADAKNQRTEAMKGCLQLVRYNPALAEVVSSSKDVIERVCNAIELPMKGFRAFRLSKEDKRSETRAQRIAIALVLRMVRCNDVAIDILRTNPRLRLDFIITKGFITFIYNDNKGSY